MNNSKVASVADSGVYQNGNGYERVEMVTHWDPHDSRRLARVSIRVDRRPSGSHADVEVWTGDNGGWQTLITWSPVRFWSAMPGFDRAGSDETKRLTLRLTEQLVAELVILAETSNI